MRAAGRRARIIATSAARATKWRAVRGRHIREFFAQPHAPLPPLILSRRRIEKMMMSDGHFTMTAQARFSGRMLYGAAGKRWHYGL